MKSAIKKARVIGLTSLLCAVSLVSCKVNLQSGDNGLYDKKNDISYCHASPVYEAISLIREYGKLTVTDTESYALYTIPGMDPTEMLATEDYNIVYAEGVAMPTLLEMAPTVLRICVDGSETVREIHMMDNAVAIASLVNAFTTGKSLSYPAGSPLRSYKARFESTQYPGFYYTLTYVEYAEDVEIDGENYGRYFLRSAFEGIFIPVGDEIHKSMGLTD